MKLLRFEFQKYLFSVTGLGVRQENFIICLFDVFSKVIGLNSVCFNSRKVTQQPGSSLVQMGRRDVHKFSFKWSFDFIMYAPRSKIKIFSKATNSLCSIFFFFYKACFTCAFSGSWILTAVIWYYWWKEICILSHKTFAACKLGRFILQLGASSVFSSIWDKRYAGRWEREDFFTFWNNINELRRKACVLVESQTVLTEWQTWKDGNGKHFEAVKLVLKQRIW